MSVKRWTAYVADDEDGNDIFVAYASDARGEWVRYSDHEAEVERLRETLRAVLMVRDMPNTVENVARAVLEGCET